MTEPWLGVVEKVREFFATAQIEACARQTGFVRRTSKLTRQVFLAVVPLGSWSTRPTSLGQLAAKAAQLPTPVDSSPEALPQRRTRRAVAFLRALLQRAFTQLPTGTTICAPELFAPFRAVYSADSTGVALAASLKELFPGQGGGASVAGAKMQLVWAYLSHRFAQVALVAGTTPDNKSIDTVVGLAQRSVLFLCDLGSLKVKALTQIAAAEASFLTRRNHQTALYAAVAGRVRRVELSRLLHRESRPLVEQAVSLGAGERLAVRRKAARVPEVVVNERRRQARAQANKRGDSPSPAHLALRAWHLFITNVPGTGWTPATVWVAYSLRGQVELGFKSWKSDLHLATLPTQTDAPTLCSLYGRLLLIVLAYTFCPALRTGLWLRQQRERSFLKRVRYLQALADRWLPTLFDSPTTLRHWLSQVCGHAHRVIATASRNRPTSAQRLRESLESQLDVLELTIKLAA